MPASQDSYVGKVLASSASGAPLLILIQLAVKLFTFAANQLILRSLSPTILGIATQLDLCSITILSFSREAVRTAIQRQPLAFSSAADVREGDGSSSGKSKSSPAIETRSTASQSVVNAAYLSIGIGIPLAAIATMLYMYLAPNEAVRVLFFHSSVSLTGAASLLELCTEPFFAIVQQHMLYKTRAAVEMSAAFTKSVTICSAFAWASWTGYDVGVLPFALGYLSYSLTLICGYSMTMLRSTGENTFSFLLMRINSDDPSAYLAGRFSRPLVSLSANVFFQSVVKHLLSQGDSMILASMASLEDQGIYSLASNYGGLIARILFQPIEESSRNLFSLLLSPSETNMRDLHTIDAAKSHLIDILRGYGILSALIIPVGPVLAPRMVHLLGGRRWSSPEVDGLLSLYCYYIPFLAFNGITEAFVSSAATPADLRRHTGWMGVFSACFALAAYLFLKIGGLGAQGLVWANIVTMAVRLLWSYAFIRAYFRRHECDLAVSDTTLRLSTYVAGSVSALIMPAGQGRLGSDIHSVFAVLGAGAAYGLLVLYLEKSYLMKQYTKASRMLVSKTERKKTD